MIKYHSGVQCKINNVHQGYTGKSQKGTENQKMDGFCNFLFKNSKSQNTV